MHLRRGSGKEWLYYELKYYARLNLNKFIKPKIPVTEYFGQKILSFERTNKIIYKK